MSTMLETSLPELAALVGELPGGDVPGGWYMSDHPDVLRGWWAYRKATEQWQADYQKLLGLTDLPRDTRCMTSGPTLLGLIPPKGMATPPRWLRKTPEGWLVTRKRTRAEKYGEVNVLFRTLSVIPRAIDFQPGMPDTLWLHNRAWPVEVRRSTNHHAAVCAFVGTNPDDADPPFEVGPEWTRLKISTFLLLRERQLAAEQVK